MWWIWFRGHSSSSSFSSADSSSSQKRVSGNDAAIGVMYCRYPGNVWVRKWWNKIQLCFIMILFVTGLTWLHFVHLHQYLHFFPEREKKIMLKHIILSIYSGSHHINCYQTKQQNKLHLYFFNTASIFLRLLYTISRCLDSCRDISGARVWWRWREKPMHWWREKTAFSTLARGRCCATWWCYACKNNTIKYNWTWKNRNECLSKSKTPTWTGGIAPVCVRCAMTIELSVRRKWVMSSLWKPVCDDAGGGGRLVKSVVGEERSHGFKILN